MMFQAAAPLVILALGVGSLLALIAIWRSHAVACVAAGAFLLAALAAIPIAARSAGADSGLFSCTLPTLGFIALILVSALLVLVVAASYWQAQTPVPREEFPLLLLIATLGAVALAAAGSFISLFLGLETMTLAMIGMIAYPIFQPGAVEAAFKYLILSGMSSAFLLFGIGLVELCTGRLGFSELLAFAPPDEAARGLLLAGLAMLAIGAAFKLSVVPFHIWVPDIYGGAPAPSGAYLAVIPKLAILAVLIRVIGQAGGALPSDITALITLVAVLSMLAGNLLALMQGNIKRILGYSSIAHLGYLLVAILAAGRIGQMAAMFYLVTYALTMIAAFGAIAALREVEMVGDLRGLFWLRPGIAAVMTLALLSLAGIPPAIGFIAKMYIFAAGVHTALWNLTGVMVASSVIGLFYYLNLILVMSMRPDAAVRPVAVPVMGRVFLGLVGLPMLVFGLAPQPLIALLQAFK